MTADPEGGPGGRPPSPYGSPPYRPGYGPPSYGPPPYGPASYGPPPYGLAGHFQSTMRAAAADRERAIDVLTAAYGEGRLTKEEFDARSGQVMNARTYGELTAIVADLPAGPAVGPPALYQPSGYYLPVPQSPTNGLAAGSLVCSIMGLLMPLLLIPGLIMGHVARDQIRTRHERGDGLAVAGLVFGYFGAAFWITLIVVIATHH